MWWGPGGESPGGKRPLVGQLCGAGVQVGLGCRTNVHCPRGVRIKLRREDFCVLQQSEPYDTTVERLCCPERVR